MAPIFESLGDTLRPERRAQAMAITPEGRRCGFEVVHEGVVVTTTSVSPNGLADAIDERLFSHLWDVGEAQWREVVEPAVVALRALPEPDRPRRRIFRHPLVVLAK
jgi:hypothetical protein